ncbi:BRO-N domain-containing protein, partial [Alicyclobacillus sendaiensis]
MQSVDMDGNPTMMEWNYYGNKVRTLVINGDPWFVASDICNILEIDTSLAINGRERVDCDGNTYRSGGLDEDEKGTATVSTPGGPQEVLIVSEPGLYSLIMKSRKPIAKPFQRWVTHEVLPSIRKTGEYKTPERRQECEIAAKQVAVMEMKARTEQA